MYAYTQNKVEICGVNTAKLQTLKNDEMRELLNRSRHGDKAARDKLIYGNLRLVLSVIQRFTSRGENPDDLFQVRSMRDTAYRALQMKEQITNEKGREPSITEIAEALGLPSEDVVIALEAIVEPVSLYEPVFSDGGDTIYIMDQIKGGTTDGDWLEEIAIKEAIHDLSPREKKILSMRFIDGKTQTEVAEEIGISQAQVSRLEKGAMSKIKSEL